MRPKLGYISIAVACNNQNGLIERHFADLNIHTDADVIVQLYGPRTVIQEHWASGRVASVRFGRYVLTVCGYTQNYGNLAWNQYTVKHSDRFVRCMKYLLGRGFAAEVVTVPAIAGIEPDTRNWMDAVLVRAKVKP